MESSCAITRHKLGWTSQQTSTRNKPAQGVDWNFGHALRVATKHGHYDIVVSLLQTAALLKPLAAELTPLKDRFSNKVHKGRTALHVAAECGHDNLIPLLEEGPSPKDAVGEYRCTLQLFQGTERSWRNCLLTAQMIPSLLIDFN